MGTLNNYNAKWSSFQWTEVSAFMEKCKIPKEIHRRVRGLQDLRHWKGTEYRTFLLYVGIVVVRKFFTDRKIFDHFLLYFCSIVICMRSDQHAENYDIAESMLKDFLINFKSLYGIDYFSSNLHNLRHLVDDVRRFGPLDSFSAYPFENRLFYIKRLLRNGNLPLSQVARRITEQQEAGSFKRTFSKEPISEYKLNHEIKNFDKSDTSFPSFLRIQKAPVFSEIEFSTFMLNASQENNKWFLTKSFDIVHLKYIVKTSDDKGQVFLCGSVLAQAVDYFEFPVKSSDLNIYVSNCNLKPARFFSISDIFCKMVKIDYNDKKSIFIPLIHTIKRK